MSVWAKFRRDVTKHRGRAAVLGVLFVAMVALGVRAFFQLQPRSATASAAVATNADVIETKKAPQDDGDGLDAQARIEESKTLWKALRLVKANATEARAAFTFDPAYYPAPAPQPELNKPIITGPAIVEIKTAPATEPAVEDPQAKLRRIQEEARGLIVKSTAVGQGTTEPMAIVNQQVVTVGQKILGFEVTAIRSRAVEFRKEGVSVARMMPDGQ